jgi:hypothetical protein
MARAPALEITLMSLVAACLAEASAAGETIASTESESTQS